MTPTVGFTLARTSDYTSTGYTPLPFTDVMLSVGSALKTCQHQFVAPTSGIYFLSFSVGVHDYYSSASYISMVLSVNGPFSSSVRVEGIDHNNLDITSNSILYQLSKNDVVSLQLYAADQYIHYSDEHYQTALTGFLYEPTHGNRIAWHVTHSPGITYNGPVTAVPFNFVLVNAGGAWSTSTYTVTIPVSGIYWLHLSGMSLPSSLTAQLNMILLVNGQSIISVVEKITNNSGNVRSHSIVYRLKQGDELLVSIPTGFNLYTLNYSASFSGFLIYPEA